MKCTKIAAKLIRTFTDRHGLKDLCKELLGVELSKQQQSSDWGAMELTSEQLAYAASDVLYLHALWAKLEAILIREDRLALAEACFAFLPTRGSWICWGTSSRTCSRTSYGDDRCVRSATLRRSDHRLLVAIRMLLATSHPKVGHEIQRHAETTQASGPSESIYGCRSEPADLYQVLAVTKSVAQL